MKGKTKAKPINPNPNQIRFRAIIWFANTIPNPKPNKECIKTCGVKQDFILSFK